ENLIYQTLISQPENPLLFLNNLTTDLIKQEWTPTDSSSYKSLLASKLFSNAPVDSDLFQKQIDNSTDHRLIKKDVMPSIKSQQLPKVQSSHSPVVMNKN
ncbi:hypothetical protein, partial [Salmonella sp. s51228]|uniref:hypothetical protein n=1 Tax=Salmonella sp. s51228 TaxID=3159652 RepID=UPI0039809DA9